MRVLRAVDKHRMVYVPDTDGRAEPVAAVVALQHMNIPPEMGVRIPDDIVLLPSSMLEKEPPE